MTDFPVYQFQSHGLFANHRADSENSLTDYHRHNEVELNFLAAGEVVYNFGGRNIVLPLRSLSVFWAGIPHRFETWRPDGEIWSLSVPLGIFLSWGLPRASFVHPLLHGEFFHESNPAQSGADETAMRRWHADLHHDGTAVEKSTRREALLFEVRGRLMRLALNAGSVRVRGGAEPGCVGKMLQHIAANYRDPGLALPGIARRAGVHPNYATDIFKKTCGVSLMRYVNHQRVTHAQRLLATTDAKVLDVAMDAGFGSVSQFHAVFRGITGASPREYAKAHEGGLEPRKTN